ncbi:MAG: hypothetical protein Rhirs2KO_19080 [Rhizobiaceae bacterium]
MIDEHKPVGRPLNIMARYAAVFALFFAYNANFIHLHFENGGYLLDSGWFAWLFQSTGLQLPNPASIGDSSYFSIHFSPYILLFSNLFHGVFGLSGIQVFSIHQGMFGGILGVACLSLLMPDETGSLRGLLILLIVAMLIFFNQVYLSTVGYPHFEMAGTAILIAGLAAARRCNWALGSFLLLFNIAIREDGGFQSAAVALAIIGESLLRRDRQTPFWLMGTVFVLSVVGSFGTLAAKEIWFPGGGTLTSNFTGSPAFAHLGGELIADRLAKFASRPELLAPVVVTVLAAIVFRRLSYLLLLVFYSPLLVLYLVAVRDLLGEFQLYYALPFLVIAMWPFYVFAREPSGLRMARPALMLIPLMMASPIVGLFGAPGPGLGFVSRTLHPANYETRAMQAAIVDSLDSAAPNARICPTVGVVALEPNQFTPEQTRWNQAPEQCDIALVFRGDLDEARVARLLADRTIEAKTEIFGPRVVELLLEPAGGD